jgi:hypothetical protein
MITRFFCFPDMQTSFVMAQAAGMVSPEGAFIRYSADWAVDVVGTITPPPTLDENGQVAETFAPLPGWHVNVRTNQPVPDSFLPFEVFPASPVRVFS